MSKMTDLNITLAKFAIQANVKERKKKKNTHGSVWLPV